jgi:hypothetical protein
MSRMAVQKIQKQAECTLNSIDDTTEVHRMLRAIAHAQNELAKAILEEE